MAEATMTKPSNAEAARLRFKFKLMRGSHIDNKGDGYIPSSDKKPATKGKLRTFHADPTKGQFPIIETDEDLAEKFNGPHPKMNKFESLQKTAIVEVDPTIRRQGETVQAYLARMNDFVKKAQSDTERLITSVDSMKKDDLEDLAAAEEIDLEGCKTVEDIRKAIKSVLKK